MNRTILHSPANRIRLLWFLALAALLVSSAMGAPVSIEVARTLRADSVANLQGLGLPVGFPAALLIVIDALLMAVFITVATLLFLRNPRERMTRITSVMLLLTAALFNAPFYEAPMPTWVIGAVTAAAETSQVAFVYAFPNGRFVPRWFPWALIPLFVWRYHAWSFVYLPRYFAMERGGEQYPWMPVRPTDYLLLVGILFVGVALQIYRYRRMANATERQQVKWLLWGTGGAVVIVGAYMLILNLAGGLLSHGNDVLLWLASRAVRDVALVMLPISLVYSISRYRLWDIDSLLSRTLSYTALTVLLALIFGGLVVISQLFFAPRIGAGQTLAVAASTLLTAAMARPLFRRIQSAIDKRFDRSTWEAQRTVADLRIRLRDQVEIEQLATHVLSAVQQTWQPENASLWIPASRDASSVRFRLEPSA